MGLVLKGKVYWNFDFFVQKKSIQNCPENLLNKCILMRGSFSTVNKPLMSNCCRSVFHKNLILVKTTTLSHLKCCWKCCLKLEMYKVCKYAKYTILDLMIYFFVVSSFCCKLNIKRLCIWFSAITWCWHFYWYWSLNNKITFTKKSGKSFTYPKISRFN